jgi:NADH dehydrogenase/NADH:ubiquinone oxidoreductase subunit G
VNITVDGRQISCREGQTIAAALIGAGQTGWRTTRRAGEARGLFCGIGVCFDCLVAVNGSAPVRACLIAAQPGDRVSTATEATA